MEPLWGSESRPSAERWHAIGLTGYLAMLAMYAVADARNAGGPDHAMTWLLGGAALAAGVAAVTGRLRGWQNRPTLVIGWPVAALLVTTLAGLVEPAATHDLSGTITTSFAYVGLTCPRWRSLTILPLGIAAWVVGSYPDLHADPLKMILPAAEWVLVAETPAWLIARLEQQSALLRMIAQTDTLTQLLNRSTLQERLSMHAGRTALVLIDLDDFKLYNDSHGHEAGDELLAAFGAALRWSVRAEDVAFRIGGDEFLLLLAGGDHAAAELVLRRLHRRWAEFGEPVSFSAGISAGEDHLLRRADQEMYAAKRARGRASSSERHPRGDHD